MTDFIVIPAIDIRNGKCVRLRRGRLAEETVYADDPVKMALRWESEGAKLLHVVDLDGALTGQPVNSKLVIKIAGAVKIPVQTGGGLRTEEQIEKMLANGISRVIVGTTACQSQERMQGFINKFKSKLAVGVDAHKGLVQINGWTSTTSLNAIDLAVRLAKMGVKTFVFTDTARDGMLTGPNTREIEKFCKSVDCDIIASGGISSLEDVINLRSLALPNLKGVIVGKALYEGKILLKDLPV